MILGSDGITVFAAGVPYNVNRDSALFDKALAAVRADDEPAFLALVQVKKVVQAALVSTLGDNVEVRNGRLFCGDREILGLLAERVLEMRNLGLDLAPISAFIVNLLKNPSKRAVDETWGFVEACNLPLTEDGCILAYKRVRKDYKDCHSGTMDNSVGKVVEMPRNGVDEDKDRTCSAGLHFCSYTYLNSFSGERVVVVKINPADIVAIPSDYNNAKGRTCRYEVVDEISLQVSGCTDTSLPVKPITQAYADSFQKSTAEGTSGMTHKKADELRAMLTKGASLRETAKTFGISRRQAARIRDNQAWVQA